MQDIMRSAQILNKIENFIFYEFILFLPTQLGKHFWPPFAIFQGLRVDYLAPTIYFTDILLGGIFLLWLIRVVHSRIKEKKNTVTFKSLINVAFFLIIFFYLRLTIIFSGDNGNGLYSFLKLSEFAFLIYYIATNIKTLSRLRAVVVCFAVATIFESGLAIAQYFHQASLNGLFYLFGERTFTADTPGIANASINGQLILRPYATFSHPNVLAGYLLCSFILCSFFIPFLRDKVSKSIVVLSLLIGSVALLLTFSRTAISFWFLVLVIMLFRRSLRKPSLQKQESPLRSAKQNFAGQARIKNHGFLLLTSCFLILASVVTLFFLFHPLVSRFLQTSLTEESVVQREQLIQETVTLIQSNLLFGVGLGNFLPVLARQNQLISLTFGLQPVHNIFLYVAAETGVIGFMLFCWFLFQTYWHNLKNGLRNYHFRQIHFSFGLLLLTVLFTGMFDHYWLTLQQGQLLFSLILGLCWVKITDL